MKQHQRVSGVLMADYLAGLLVIPRAQRVGIYFHSEWLATGKDSRSQHPLRGCGMTRLGASRLWITVPVSSHDGVQPARLVAPVNGAVLLADDAQCGVALRWTPLIPRPRDDGAAYRVRVWQLMQGDNAMKACHFVWNVQALNRVGTPTPGADGSDNTFRFAVGGPAK